MPALSPCCSPTHDSISNSICGQSMELSVRPFKATTDAAKPDESQQQQQQQEPEQQADVVDESLQKGLILLPGKHCPQCKSTLVMIASGSRPASIPASPLVEKKESTVVQQIDLETKLKSKEIGDEKEQEEEDDTPPVVEDGPLQPLIDIPFCVVCQAHVILDRSQVSALVAAAPGKKVAASGAILVATPSAEEAWWEEMLLLRAATQEVEMILPLTGDTPRYSMDKAVGSFSLDSPVTPSQRDEAKQSERFSEENTSDEKQAQNVSTGTDPISHELGLKMKSLIKDSTDGDEEDEEKDDLMKFLSLDTADEEEDELWDEIEVIHCENSKKNPIKVIGEEERIATPLRRGAAPRPETPKSPLVATPQSAGVSTLASGQEVLTPASALPVMTKSKTRSPTPPRRNATSNLTVPTQEPSSERTAQRPPLAPTTTPRAMGVAANNSMSGASVSTSMSSLSGTVESKNVLATPVSAGSPQSVPDTDQRMEPSEYVPEYTIRRDIATQVLGEKMLAGYGLTEELCRNCIMPQMTNLDGKLECVVCPQLIARALHERAQKAIPHLERPMLEPDTKDAETGNKPAVVSKPTTALVQQENLAFEGSQATRDTSESASATWYPPLAVPKASSKVRTTVTHLEVDSDNFSVHTTPSLRTRTMDIETAPDDVASVHTASSLPAQKETKHFSSIRRLIKSARNKLDVVNANSVPVTDTSKQSAANVDPNSTNEHPLVEPSAEQPSEGVTKTCSFSPPSMDVEETTLKLCDSVGTTPQMLQSGCCAEGADESQPILVPRVEEVRQLTLDAPTPVPLDSPSVQHSIHHSVVDPVYCTTQIDSTVMPVLKELMTPLPEPVEETLKSQSHDETEHESDDKTTEMVEPSDDKSGDTKGALKGIAEASVSCDTDPKENQLLQKWEKEATAMEKEAEAAMLRARFALERIKQARMPSPAHEKTAEKAADEFIEEATEETTDKEDIEPIVVERTLQTDDKTDEEVEPAEQSPFEAASSVDTAQTEKQIEINAPGNAKLEATETQTVASEGIEVSVVDSVAAEEPNKLEETVEVTNIMEQEDIVVSTSLQSNENEGEKFSNIIVSKESHEDRGAPVAQIDAVVGSSSEGSSSRDRMVSRTETYGSIPGPWRQLHAEAHLVNLRRIVAGWKKLDKRCVGSNCNKALLLKKGRYIECTICGGSGNGRDGLYGEMAQNAVRFGLPSPVTDDDSKSEVEAPVAETVAEAEADQERRPLVTSSPEENSHNEPPVDASEEKLVSENNATENVAVEESKQKRAEAVPAVIAESDENDPKLSKDCSQPSKTGVKAGRAKNMVKKFLKKAVQRKKQRKPGSHPQFYIDGKPNNSLNLPEDLTNRSVEELSTDFESKRSLVSTEIGKRMTRGWTLLDSACPYCIMPLMTDKNGKNEICVLCGCVGSIGHSKSISLSETGNDEKARSSSLSVAEESLSDQIKRSSRSRSVSSACSFRKKDPEDCDNGSLPKEEAPRDPSPMKPSKTETKANDNVVKTTEHASHKEEAPQPKAIPMLTEEKQKSTGSSETSDAGKEPATREESDSVEEGKEQSNQDKLEKELDDTEQATKNQEKDLKLSPDTEKKASNTQSVDITSRSITKDGFGSSNKAVAVEETELPVGAAAVTTANEGSNGGRQRPAPLMLETNTRIATLREDEPVPAIARKAANDAVPETVVVCEQDHEPVVKPSSPKKSPTILSWLRKGKEKKSANSKSDPPALRGHDAVKKNSVDAEESIVGSPTSKGMTDPFPFHSNTATDTTRPATVAGIAERKHGIKKEKELEPGAARNENREDVDTNQDSVAVQSTREGLHTKQLTVDKSLTLEIPVNFDVSDEASLRQLIEDAKLKGPLLSASTPRRALPSPGMVAAPALRAPLTSPSGSVASSKKSSSKRSSSKKSSSSSKRSNKITPRSTHSRPRITPENSSRPSRRSTTVSRMNSHDSSVSGLESRGSVATPDYSSRPRPNFIPATVSTTFSKKIKSKLPGVTAATAVVPTSHPDVYVLEQSLQEELPATDNELDCAASVDSEALDALMDRIEETKSKLEEQPSLSGIQSQSQLRELIDNLAMAAAEMQQME